jgi:hypothetical protein
MSKGIYHLKPAGSGFALAPSGANVTASLSADYKFIHVWSDADVHIRLSTTATTDHDSLKIKANTPYVFPVDPSGNIAANGTANIEIHYME